MKVRPWPLVLLAGVQIFSPIFTVLFNAWVLGVKPWYVVGWILERPALEVFEILALMPLAGIAIYRMKAWSYGVFFAALGWSMVRNLSHWHYASRAYSFWLVLLVYAFQFGLALYFMIPAVRRTYLDPRVRWWEAKRRYLLEIPIDVIGLGGERSQGILQNVSEGGVFLKSPQTLKAGEKVELSFRVLDVPYQAAGEIMYASAAVNGAHGYGIQFLHTSKSRKQFHHLAYGLDLIGIPQRDPETALPWYIGAWDWALRLIRTGKGLLPE